MTYRVLILPRAAKEVESLPQRDYERVLEALRALERNPCPPGCIKLRGREGWRIRQGDYRILYEIADQEHKVTVLHVRHRREAYRFD